jgi:hypothetical protein
MTKYEYKVDYFRANATPSEVEKGTAGPKVAQQIELKINQRMVAGYEFHQQFNTWVEVKPGCLSSLLGKKIDFVNMTTMVFRKALD